MFLGNHVRKVTGRKNIHVWWGECHVHAAVKPIAITSVRHEHPSADFMVHPECGCTTPAMYLASEGDQSMVCRFMKMITLENLRDSLLHDQFEVSVPPHIAERARLPI